MSSMGWQASTIFNESMIQGQKSKQSINDIREETRQVKFKTKLQLTESPIDQGQTLWAATIARLTMPVLKETGKTKNKIKLHP